MVAVGSVGGGKAGHAERGEFFCDVKGLVEERDALLLLGRPGQTLRGIQDHRSSRWFPAAKYHRG